MALLIKADGTTSTLLPANKTFTLEELQAAVGGYIELVYTRDGKQMYINEEGKLKLLPVNRLASNLYAQSPMDVIVGDALVCGSKEVK